MFSIRSRRSCAPSAERTISSALLTMATWTGDNRERMLQMLQNQLKQVRGLHKNEVSRSGKAILAALERARKLPDSELPSHPKRSSRKGVGAVVDLLKAYLRQASEETGVAVETLTTSSELERLVRDEKRERYADDHPLLRGWRRELVGEDLLQILGGKRYLAVEPGEGRLRVEQAGG